MSTSSESALIIKRLTLKVCCIFTYLALCDSLEGACVCMLKDNICSTGFLHQLRVIQI